MTRDRSRRRTLGWTLLLTIAALLAGCRPTPVLTVNGVAIDRTDLEAAAHAAGVPVDEPTLLDALIEEALLLQDATALGLTVAAADLEAALAQSAPEAPPFDEP